MSGCKLIRHGVIAVAVARFVSAHNDDHITQHCVLRQVPIVDCQWRGRQVRCLARIKLGQMAYRALRTKMTRTSGLQDASFAFVDACYDFANAKAENFAESDCEQVENAQRAVGLSSPTG